MTRLFKHKLMIYLFTILIVLLIEVAMYAIVFGNAFPKYFMLEITFFTILYLPIILIKSHKVSIGYSTITLIIISVFYMLNVTLSYASNDIFSFDYLYLANEAASVFSMDYINWGYVAILLGLLSLYYVGIFISFKFYKYDKKISNQPILSLSASLIILMSSLIIRNINYTIIEKDNSDKEIYANMSGVEIIEFTSENLKRSSLKNYGLFGYIFGELRAYTNISTNTPVEGNPDDDIIEGPENPAFGFLEGMNVITIMIETGCTFAINEYLTPNLWRIKEEGLFFNNNLTKNKTNISEYIGIAGSAPRQMGSGYEVPFSIPNLLKNKGYETNYFHCNYSDFYQRGSVIEKVGFENRYFVLDIAPNLQWNNNYNGNYPLDTEFYEYIKDELIPEDNGKPFYSFWSTLSTHGPYNFKWATKNKKKFNDLGYYTKIAEAEELGLWENICSDDSNLVQNQIEWYQCAMMNFDDTLGLILDRLEETNQLDNTLLVLYGDHDIYYDIDLEMGLKNYVYNLNDDPTYPLQYETIMMMYNPKLVDYYKEVNNIPKSEKAIYSDFTSPYIIAPTILELLGVKHNASNYVGTSIFQTKTALDNIFYSHELKVYFTDKIYGTEIERFDYIGTDDMEYIELVKEKALELIAKIDRFNNMYASNKFE
ncbi:MAG: sulfatase-like hydrolase/transferase [Acholeplasmatales bacterium]|nr:sulfatase-like hydrolase/transferase [Acholeplasmatales bacterium]